ncbi:MAG: transposase [Acidimicrobiales bacterium]|nr:MAG: transposase [Acidimicrobiales bacterium]
MQRRSKRKGLDEFDVEPEWANEAVDDPDRLVASDPGSKSGESVRIVGYSRSADRILTVIVVPKSVTPVSDEWWGANAWASNESDQRKYYEELEEER